MLACHAKVAGSILAGIVMFKCLILKILNIFREQPLSVTDIGEIQGPQQRTTEDSIGNQWLEFKHGFWAPRESVVNAKQWAQRKQESDAYRKKYGY